MLSASSSATPNSRGAASSTSAFPSRGNASGGPPRRDQGDSQRSVETLDLAPALRAKLINGGFRTVGDLRDVTPARLCQELGLPMDEALSVVRQYNQDPYPSTSALDLLERDLKRRPITTCCAALDGLLDAKGSGVPVGVVSEFCGEPGVGKTQIGMQLCVNVQIPRSLGGAGGEALYIDSEGSFIVDRLAQIAAATVAETNERLLSRGLEADLMDLEQVLDRIHYFRVHDYVEQVAVTHLLAETLAENPRIKLIVVDSIAFHFRQHFSDMAMRQRLLLNIANTFMALAKKHELAVVMMNQMTTKLGKDASGENQYGTMVPALGESWGHCNTHRVILAFDNGGRTRKAILVKSPNMQGRTVYYTITRDGVRDVESARRAPEGGDTSAEPRKRPRTDE
ncbi:P-loop containing nucleoside triphosphate hydrolase protein [Hyaloraphidium curvatum]|nr:P-loop containing nucleoside triphosphate hydrolase protein [Hyaloraphidium curvatum]